MSRDHDVFESLMASEPLIRVKNSAPQIDCSTLTELLKTMVTKLEDQTIIVNKQQEQIDRLQREVTFLRQQQEDVQVLKRDLKRSSSDMESVKAKQRLQQQRIERLQCEFDELAQASPRSPSSAASDEQHNDNVENDLVEENIIHYTQAPSSVSPSSVPPPPAAEVVTPPAAHTVTTPRQLTPADVPSLFSPQPSAPPPPPAPAAAATTIVEPTPSPNRQRPMAGIDVAESNEGLIVSGVKPGGPASLAGLEIGDALLTVNGESMPSRSGFAAFLERCTIGQALDIVFIRQGKRHVTRLYVVSGAASRQR